MCIISPPVYGIPEARLTGSAPGALPPYWAERLGKTHLSAGRVSERGGELCEIAEPQVITKGSAVLTLQGALQV